MTDTKAREVWDEMERVRGVYHPNDKDAYIEAFQGAIEAAERRGHVWAFREARQLYITHMWMDDMATRLSGFCVMLNAVANRIERGET